MNRIKITSKIKRFAILVSALIVICIGTFIACVYLQDDPLQIESMTVNAGDEFTVKFRVKFDAVANVDGTRMVISVLAPKIWNLSKNAVLTYEIEDEKGTFYPMYLISNQISPKQDQWQGMTWAAALASKFGVGMNIIDSDMEWVSFWSNAYPVRTNQFIKYVEVFIKIKTSDDNVKCKLGFFVNHSDDGLSNNEDHWKVILMDEPFETVGAQGNIIDFCEEHPNMAFPMFVTKDDIVTIKYLSGVEVTNLQGNSVKTALYGATEVYLCASAYTDNGNRYDVLETNEKTRMISENDLNFSLTFWPANYFGIPQNEHISKIEYYFVNADKSIQVKELNSDGSELPYPYPFFCR